MKLQNDKKTEINNVGTTSNRRSLLRILSAASLGVIAIDAANSKKAVAAPPADSTITHLDSVTVLRQTIPQYNGQQFLLLGYSLAGKGGGIVYYDAADTSTKDNGVTVFVNGSYRFKRPADTEINVHMAGAIGDNNNDDTDAINQALTVVKAVNYSVRPLLVFSPGNYRVSTITLDGQGVNYRFDSAMIIGNAKSATDCVVEIKAGYSSIRGLAVSAATGSGNTNYACAVHWYTNDLNSYYPGRNHFEDWYLTEAKIGLVIGAMPSQGTGSMPPQGTIQPSGVATDAPLSESSCSNFRFYGCVKGIYMHQTNGKLTFSGCNVSGDTTTYSGYATPYDCIAVEIYNGELDFSGGSIEQLFQTSGALIKAAAGNINIRGAVMESVAPIQIDNNSVVRLNNILNWGLNNNNLPFFQMSSNASGNLDVSDSFLIRPAGYYSGQSIVKSVSSFLTNSFSVNTSFICNFNQVEFRDPDWRMGSTHNPLVSGARFILNNCWITTHSGSTRLSALKIKEQHNLLPAVVDQAATSITKYPTRTASTSGGWTFFISTTACAYGSDNSDVPMFEGQQTSYSLRLTSAGAQQTIATSPHIPIETQRTYQLKGFIKTNGSNAQILFRFYWYDFSGGAASNKSTDMYSGPSIGITDSHWIPFAFYAQAPADATKCKLHIEVSNSAEIWLANLQLI